MVRSMLSLTDLLLVCSVWGAWLQRNTTAYQGGCRQVKFLLPEKESHLKGHVFRNLTIFAGHTSCEDQCLMEDECVSINFGPSVSEKVVCELSNSDHFQNQEDLQPRNGWTYRGTENLCSLYKPCLNNATCVMGYTDKRYHCECAPGYEGEHCENEPIGLSSSNPGISCKHIQQSTVSRENGEYWIDPEQNGSPLKVFCDMTTDRGGWLLVANMIFSVSVSNSSFNWTSGSTYRDISNFRSNEMGISKASMKKLRTHLSFTQIRFHCRKQQGRTFHVITAANSTGEAVVQYFTGETNTLPASCGSFQRMDDDNSQLSVRCDRWGYDGAYYVGKWGHHMKQGRDRMYNHAASVPFEYSWAIVKGLWFCDDDGNNTLTKNSGDFWKIYVR